MGYVSEGKATFSVESGMLLSVSSVFYDSSWGRQTGWCLNFEIISFLINTPCRMVIYDGKKFKKVILLTLFCVFLNYLDLKFAGVVP